MSVLVTGLYSLFPQRCEALYEVCQPFVFVDEVRLREESLEFGLLREVVCRVELLDVSEVLSCEHEQLGVFEDHSRRGAETVGRQSDLSEDLADLHAVHEDAVLL